MIFPLSNKTTHILTTVKTENWKHLGIAIPLFIVSLSSLYESAALFTLKLKYERLCHNITFVSMKISLLHKQFLSKKKKLLLNILIR